MGGDPIETVTGVLTERIAALVFTTRSMLLSHQAGV